MRRINSANPRIRTCDLWGAFSDLGAVLLAAAVKSMPRNLLGCEPGGGGRRVQGSRARAWPAGVPSVPQKPFGTH